MRRLAVAATVLACAPAAEAKLVFERADGTVIKPGKTRVWCGPWSEEVATPALHIGGPRGGKFYWHIAAVRRDLLRGKAFRFPNSFVSDHPRGADLFAVDGKNEVSTSEEEAGGRVFYRRISCRPGARVSFKIDARAGSEIFQFPTLSVSGTFRGRVGTRTWPLP